MSKPKVSIITVCYNSAKTIEKNIVSVNNQTYKNIEHIFIDGKSTDNTVNIIKKLSPTSKLISEKDSGIYDAMNKGYKVATGDIIGTLNSDDFYLDNNVIQNIVDCFVNNDIDYFCAKISFFDPDTGKFSHYFGDSPALKKNLKIMSIAHPTVYIRKDIVNKIGLYDISYKTASDYDWCMRLVQGNYRYYYLQKAIVVMNTGGASSKYYFNNLKEAYEIKCKLFPKKRFVFLVHRCEMLIKIFIRKTLEKMNFNSIVKWIRNSEGKLK